MNQLPLVGRCGFVSHLRIVAFLLCSAVFGSASSVVRPQVVALRIHTVDNEDFKLPHGEHLNSVRFLTDGVRTVEIPAGSLLHLPVRGRIRVAERRVGDLVDWRKFFEANCDEIRQVGAGREQLRGNLEMHPSVFAHLQRSGKVGIAIAAGRPVALPQ